MAEWVQESYCESSVKRCSPNVKPLQTASWGENYLVIESRTCIFCFAFKTFEKEPAFPFSCWVLNKGTTGTIFITFLIWRGPWLGIEPGTSRTWNQHSTTRLSRQGILRTCFRRKSGRLRDCFRGMFRVGDLFREVSNLRKWFRGISRGRGLYQRVFRVIVSFKMGNWFRGFTRVILEAVWWWFLQVYSQALQIHKDARIVDALKILEVLDDNRETGNDTDGFLLDLYKGIGRFSLITYVLQKHPRYRYDFRAGFL